MSDTSQPGLSENRIGLKARPWQGAAASGESDRIESEVVAGCFNLPLSLNLNLPVGRAVEAGRTGGGGGGGEKEAGVGAPCWTGGAAGFMPGFIGGAGGACDTGGKRGAAGASCIAAARCSSNRACRCASIVRALPPRAWE